MHLKIHQGLKAVRCRICFVLLWDKILLLTETYSENGKNYKCENFKNHPTVSSRFPPPMLISLLEMLSFGSLFFFTCWIVGADFGGFEAEEGRVE